MIHKAILGSIERFLSVYIEHTAGRFPIWLAPEQVRIITVNQEKAAVDFAAGMEQEARKLGLRVYVDNANDSVGKKIRAAEVARVPYTVVVGEKEVATGQVSPRIRKDMVVIDAPVTLGAEEFLKTVDNETRARVIKTSL
jgi:threonyl-tRNA synthetase